MLWCRSHARSLTRAPPRQKQPRLLRSLTRLLSLPSLRPQPCLRLLHRSQQPLLHLRLPRQRLLRRRCPLPRSSRSASMPMQCTPQNSGGGWLCSGMQVTDLEAGQDPAADVLSTMQETPFSAQPAQQAQAPPPPLPAYGASAVPPPPAHSAHSTPSVPAFPPGPPPPPPMVNIHPRSADRSHASCQLRRKWAHTEASRLYATAAEGAM